MANLVLITGATGSLGPAIVKELISSGFKIRIFAKDLPYVYFQKDNADVDLIIGDIIDADLKKVLDNCKIVIHMAALAHINDPGPEMEAMYEKINVEGTRRIINAAINMGIKRFVFFSTIGVYGPTINIIANENTPPNPESPYARSKLRAEKIVLSAKNEKGNPISTVIRLATVYGPNDKGNFRKLAKMASKGLSISIGSGSTKKTLIYEKDVALAIKEILNNGLTINKVYNVTDGAIHSVRETLVAIYEALGRKPKIVNLPEMPVRIGLRFLEKSTNLLGLKSKYGEWIINKYIQDFSVSGQKFIRETGFKAKYDLISGWQETIKEMIKRGDL
jgi:UDP-glucose 4-epimerase